MNEKRMNGSIYITIYIRGWMISTGRNGWITTNGSDLYSGRNGWSQRGGMDESQRMDLIEQMDPIEWIRFESIVYILYLQSQQATSNKYSTYSIYSLLINTHSKMLSRLSPWTMCANFPEEVRRTVEERKIKTSKTCLPLGPTVRTTK